MTIWNKEFGHHWEKRIRNKLQKELSYWMRPENVESGYVSFGEVLALNEGSRAFNMVMERTEDRNEAAALSDRVTHRVTQLATTIKAQAEAV